MIDYFEDEVLSLHQAADLMGKAYPTLYRWATTGVCGIKLKTIWDGRLCTSRKCLQEFLQQVSENRSRTLAAKRLPPREPASR